MGKYALVTVGAALFFIGCGGNKSDSVGKSASVPAGAVRNPAVMSVASQTVTADEITSSLVENSGTLVPLTERLRPLAQSLDMESFRQKARPDVERAVADKISYVLLYEQTKRKIGDALDKTLEKQVDNEVRKFVANDFGGDSIKAGEYLKNSGLDWKTFRQSQERLILISAQLPQTRPVTFSDLVDHYNRIKERVYAVPASITLRLIDIEVEKVQVSEPNYNKLETARQLADDLLVRIRSGEDFGELAKKHSNGYMCESGGLWKPVQPDSLAPPYDVLAEQADKMQPGDVTAPIVTKTADRIFIMKLEQKQPKTYKPLAEVQRQIEQAIILDRRRQASGRLNEQLARRMDLAQSGEFVEFCLEKLYQTNRPER